MMQKVHLKIKIFKFFIIFNFNTFSKFLKESNFNFPSQYLNTLSVIIFS